jgi:thiol-disulfide isomerase/thioredoxin
MIIKIKDELEVGDFLEKERFLVLYFFTKSCIYCKETNGFIDILSGRRKDLLFLKIDGEKFNRIALNNYGIFSVPSFVFLMEGVAKKTISGPTNLDDLEDAINELYI